MLTTEKTVENPAPKQHKSKKSLNYRLHTDFKRIKRHVLNVLASGKVPVNGICYHISRDGEDAFSGLSKEFIGVREAAYKAWPFYSGDPTYPIASSSALLTAHHSYIYRRTNNTLWVGAQLEHRISLLDHLIEYFKPPVMPRTELLNLLRVDMQADGYTHREGICGAILHNLPYAAHIVCGEARRAISPKNYVYPVELKGEKGGISFSHHAQHGTLWVGEYGAARKAYALKIADYVEDNYTVKLNKKVNKKVISGSREQQLFRKVIKAGYYSFAEFSHNRSRFMCYAVRFACRAGVITTEEKELLVNSINTYLRGSCVLINALYRARIIRNVILDNKQNQKVLLNTYINWDKRPELKRVV